MQQTIKQRLDLFISDSQLSNYAFCKKAEFSGSFLQKFNDPTASSLLKISNAFPELNIHWLVTGKGKMLLNKKATL